jgi:hypothetical protein
MLNHTYDMASSVPKGCVWIRFFLFLVERCENHDKRLDFSSLLVAAASLNWNTRIEDATRIVILRNTASTGRASPNSETKHPKVHGH